jgi:hypothetical protein
MTKQRSEFAKDANQVAGIILVVCLVMACVMALMVGLIYSIDECYGIPLLSIPVIAGLVYVFTKE